MLVFIARNIAGKGASKKVTEYKDNGLQSDLIMEFAFHGVGCRVEMGGKSVDFDFGEEGRHDGFDAWRLWLYAEERHDRYPMFRDCHSIEHLIMEAARQGRIRHLNIQGDISPHLFYLAIESSKKLDALPDPIPLFKQDQE